MFAVIARICNVVYISYSTITECVLVIIMLQVVVLTFLPELFYSALQTGRIGQIKNVGAKSSEL